MAEKHFKLLRSVRDDIEFFTVADTGESGMSVSGLAILCGVSHQASSKLVKNLATQSPSRWLNPLVGKDFNLATNRRKQGGKTRVLKAEVCTLILQHYAFRGNETAQYSLTKFSTDGMTRWIQGVTGWTPQKGIIRQEYGHLILDEPQPWEEHYNPEWRSHAMRLTGLHWNCRAMSHFLNEAVYGYIPTPVRDRLNEVNPLDGKGRRRYKQHQFFAKEADILVLRSHISKTQLLMEASASLPEFRRLMQAKFKGVYQMSLLT